MFRHERRLQFDARPERPDAAFAKLLQEILAGQASETTAMMQYLYQGCNCRGPAKYRDMLMATAAEEVGHVEMVATMVARPLEKAPGHRPEAAAAGGDSAVGAVMGGMHPQHFLTGGAERAAARQRRQPVEQQLRVGHRQPARRLPRQRRARVHRAAQPVPARTSSATTVACATCSRSSSPRDTMHQNQFLAADRRSSRSRGSRRRPVPSAFPRDEERAARVRVLEPHRRRRRRRRRVGQGARRPTATASSSSSTHPKPLGDAPELGHLQPARAGHGVEAGAPRPEAGVRT
jgi:Mn-containing catalase